MIENDVEFKKPHLNFTCEQYNKLIALYVKFRGKDCSEGYYIILFHFYFICIFQKRQNALNVISAEKIGNNQEPYATFT